MSKIFNSIKVSKEVKQKVDKIFDTKFYCHKFTQTGEINEPCLEQCQRCEFAHKNKS